MEYELEDWHPGMDAPAWEEDVINQDDDDHLADADRAIKIPEQEDG